MLPTTIRSHFLHVYLIYIQQYQILLAPPEWKKTWWKYFTLILQIYSNGRTVITDVDKDKPWTKICKLHQKPRSLCTGLALFSSTTLSPIFQCDFLLRVSFPIVYVMWYTVIVYIPSSIVSSLWEQQLLQTALFNNKHRQKTNKYLSTVVCLLPQRPHFPSRQHEIFCFEYTCFFFFFMFIRV